MHPMARHKACTVGARQILAHIAPEHMLPRQRGVCLQLLCTGISAALLGLSRPPIGASSLRQLCRSWAPCSTTCTVHQASTAGYAHAAASCDLMKLHVLRCCREEGDQTKVLVQIEKASFKAGLEQRCLVLHLSPDGVVTNVASGSTLFGLKPAQLLGHRVDSFVDVFEQANAAGLEPSTILSSMLDK
jgi:hypothetical protein